MNLYLLRHGEAENRASSDANRQLTERGRKSVINIASQFAARNPVIERCFVSPYIRAQQTAELLLAHVSQDLHVETMPALVPETPASELINFLGGLDVENVLLVSHNPLLTELLALLSQGHLENIYLVDTSELLCLSMDTPGLGMGAVEYSLNA